ncbi:MAG: Hsp20/alpha crystallin family protein [Phycisphaerae bacterium]|nr:Hsp20/alpha crystallin family protein [Phycisphaerae bacterium]
MPENKNKVNVNVEPARVSVGEDAYTPLVDIYENADGTTVLVAEVPGAKQESIDIRVDKGVLTLMADGRRPEPDESFSRTYTGFVGGEYFRAFAISDEVDRDAIQASLQDGLLVITLPRAAAAKTRKIEIS